VDVFKFIMSYDPKLNLKIILKVAVLGLNFTVTGGPSAGKRRTVYGLVVKDSNFLDRICVNLTSPEIYTADHSRGSAGPSACV
jgi:hypothetical protein